MIGRGASWLAIVLSGALIALVGVWLYAERVWSRWAPLSPEDAFVYGTIGLETFPLKYAAVLQRLSADSFFPDGEGDVWADFGFLTPDDAPGATCVSNVADWAPVGVGVSSYLPVTAFQTSTPFAGLTCAVCHAARLRLPGGRRSGVIVGMGNPELDVIAWSDGVKNAILDPRLTTDAIMAAYDEQCGEIDADRDMETGPIDALVDRIVISAWLGGFRSVVADDLAKYDLPYDGADIRDAKLIPAGPGRTRPFRSVVRVSLALPGADNYALSKIPAVWEQATDLRPRSQYDGSIGSPVTRSLIAAYASGASPLALSKPEIAHNVRAAAAYTEALNVDGGDVPVFADLFEPPPRDLIERGFQTYLKFCNGCHGYRPLDGGRWSFDGAKARHRLMPLAALGTDPERVIFRYATMLPLALQTDFPGWQEERFAQARALEDAAAEALDAGKPALAALWRRQREKLADAAREHRLGHPFYFPPGDLTAEVGYFNNPIPRAWLRAPYLHNGAVPTLAQLVNLDARPARFCRGANVYDPEKIGYAAPAPAGGACPPETPFLFDANARGNSNRGHDYPWAFDDPARDPEALRALLAYLTVL